ncbi:DUF5627 domain-containing protein [Saccharicrinis fermentans]|uniref:DUF5627 domain-containing protein n=1 Tax=Saccharicrinis fermentans TaxID=982 RepID=UPI0004B30648|nr:DUF5627 domain-containing protein [Saccharicrinis fermentans]
MNDAFFADADAIRNTYVIPLEMTKVVNADSILSGEAKINDASKCNISDWEVAPKDYVLYCVKYINPYHAIYLRRGVDVILQDGASTTLERRADYVENDELCELTTVSLNSVEFPISISNVNDENQNCSLLLTFDDENNCVVSTSTSGFTITGNGKFVNNGEKNSWGDKDRNAIYLDYTIEVAGKTYATLDTLVVRDRGVAAENFSPSYMKE